MRTSLIILALMTLSACGTAPVEAAGACAGQAIVGTWFAAAEPSRMILSNDCSGSEDFCQLEFTWKPIDSKTVEVQITHTAGSGCMTVGTHMCEYTATNLDLFFKCDMAPAWLAYARQ
jgi:hypothetical protein